MTIEELLVDYPNLERDDFLACQDFELRRMNLS